MRVNKYLKLFLIVFLSACHLSRTMNPVAIYQAEESLPQKTIQDKPVFVTIQQERTTNMRCAQLWTEMVRETQVSLQDQNSNSTDYTSNGTQDYKKTKNVTSEWNSAKCSYVDTDSQAGRLNNVLVSYLETYMSFEDRIAVLSSNSSKSQYKIRVIVSSIVPDIEAKEQAQENTLFNLGYITSMTTPYVGVAASSLGPIGGLLQGFDIITGIPTTWSSTDKIGEVTADIKITNNYGEIISAFTEKTTYGVNYSVVGKDWLIQSAMGSGSMNMHLVSLEEAIQEIARKASKKAAKLIVN